MKWTIHYGDGTCVSGSSDEDVYDAPRVDVQVIAVINAISGVAFEQGQDYFIYEPERVTLGFVGTDIHGVHDHLIRAKRQCVFFGRHMLDDEFRKFYSDVKASYPNKSALTKNEVKSGLKI